MEADAEKEIGKLDKILESVDLLFARVTDIGLAQQKMRAHLELNTQAIDLQTAEQKLMSHQIGEAGQALAQLRMQQNRHQT